MDGSIGMYSWSGLEEQRTVVERWLAQHCRDQNEADDVVQETLLRAARYRGSLADEGRLRSWMITIAHNVWIDHQRREGRLRRVSDSEAALEGLISDGWEPDSGSGDQLELDGWRVGESEALKELSGVLAGLREEDRELLSAYYGCKGGCKEVAAQQGVPPQVIKVRLFRARRRLLSAMRRHIALELGTHREGRRP